LTLAGLNGAAGIIMARRSMRMELKPAMSFLLGGMAARLGVTIILVWICLAVLELHQAALALSLMIAFFILIMVEGFFFHTQCERNKKPIVRKRKRREHSELERF
jgi:uncharacterized membrane protein YraQ (UPF0718 family)